MTRAQRSARTIELNMSILDRPSPAQTRRGRAEPDVNDPPFQHNVAICFVAVESGGGWRVRYRASPAPDARRVGGQRVLPPTFGIRIDPSTADLFHGAQLAQP